MAQLKSFSMDNRNMYMVNTMIADGLATQGALVINSHSIDLVIWNIPVLVPYGFKVLALKVYSSEFFAY